MIALVALPRGNFFASSAYLLSKLAETESAHLALLLHGDGEPPDDVLPRLFTALPLLSQYVTTTAVEPKEEEPVVATSTVETTVETFGAAIKRARVEAGYTQASLAQKIGWDEKTIGNWEQSHSRPTVDGYEALCEALPALLNVPTPEGLRKRTRQARDAASEAASEAPPDYASLGAAYGLAVGAARLRHAAVAAAKEALLQAEERAKEADAAVRAAHDALLNGSSPKE